MEKTRSPKEGPWPNGEIKGINGETERTPSPEVSEEKKKEPRPKEGLSDKGMAAASEDAAIAKGRGWSLRIYALGEKSRASFGTKTQGKRDFGT